MVYILVIIFLAFIGLFLFSNLPAPTLVCYKESAFEIEELQRLLEREGIPSFTKAVRVRGAQYTSPSLHVVDSTDIEKAKDIIQKQVLSTR